MRSAPFASTNRLGLWLLAASVAGACALGLGMARSTLERGLGSLVSADLQALSTTQMLLWLLYLVAAVMLPVYHLRPILRYLRGTAGIGDACIRTECIQCLWRVPALLFSIHVTPSVPLFLSIFLDMLGRIGRITAMSISARRWARATPPALPPTPVSSRRRPGSPTPAKLYHAASLHRLRARPGWRSRPAPG